MLPISYYDHVSPVIYILTERISSSCDFMICNWFGFARRTELKKLIRKELRISTAVISDSDVENLAAALDGDRTGPPAEDNRHVHKRICSISMGSIDL